MASGRKRSAVERAPRARRSRSGSQSASRSADTNSPGSSGIEEPAVLAGAQQVVGAAGVARAEHGQAAGEGLVHDEAPAVGERREDEQARRRVVVDELGVLDLRNVDDRPIGLGGARLFDHRRERPAADERAASTRRGSSPAAAPRRRAAARRPSPAPAGRRRARSDRGSRGPRRARAARPRARRRRAPRGRHRDRARWARRRCAPARRPAPRAPRAPGGPFRSRRRRWRAAAAAAREPIAR